MWKSTGSFIAEGDDGLRHTIHVYTKAADAGTRGDPTATAGRVGKLRTSDGLRVTRLEKGVYRIDDTGVTLRSTSPDAP